MPHFLRSSLAACLLITAAPAAVLGQMASDAVHETAVEVTVGSLSVPGTSSQNIATRGSASVVGLRVSRHLRPRLAAIASLGYGEAKDARRDVYERPSGPRRVDTYDLRTLLALAGVEYMWPLARAEGAIGLEAGWAREDWRLVNHVDPAGLPAPTSSSGGGVAAAARLGLRYPVGTRVAIGGAVRLLGGAGTLEGNGARVLPEIGLRWRF